MEQFRKRLIGQAIAYNSVLTIEYLDNKETSALICYAHPEERTELIQEYINLKNKQLL